MTDVVVPVEQIAKARRIAGYVLIRRENHVWVHCHRPQIPLQCREG